MTCFDGISKCGRYSEEEGMSHSTSTVLDLIMGASQLVLFQVSVSVYRFTSVFMSSGRIVNMQNNRVFKLDL